MKWHKILSKHLSCLDLSDRIPPAESKKWQELLERINNSYLEADNQRDVLERSMEISSQELVELNQKLENAQHIAHLGYWVYDRTNDTLIWSKEIYKLFGLESATCPPNFEGVMRMIHEQDQIQLRELVDKAFADGIAYECEFRIQTSKNEERWCYAKGQPQISDNNTILSGIVMDITGRKKVEEEVALLNRQLLLSARHAGMADVATSILHNVGNILNSANVSLELLQENIGQTHYKNFFAVIAMIKENLASLGVYLTQDPKGKLIPEYLVAAGEIIECEYNSFSREIVNLSKSLQHVKDIVATQKSLSTVPGITENVFLPEVIETALTMSGECFEANNIEIIKNYNNTSFIATDSSKLLQILVNLIQNAKDAIVANPNGSEKKIAISIQEKLPNSALIIFEDNGIGIDSEILTNIFSFGFTTKKNGHGFGLHASALAAKELGGMLQAHSEGINKGATFTLTLPISAPDKGDKTNDARN